ncbi:MAG: MgtC/SapB family protein [Hyphomicrobium sp.]|uniref:MgtC/SapB family protein n=1 Tax=Hyphomicrobium sp. TaxID=82 RepID=UPI0039E66E51
MDTPSDYDVIWRLVVAVLCGGLIGLERDLRRMPTGFRTMAIVSLGACVATLAAVRHGDTDGFSRVAQGVLTGIGFLGAGVILQHGKIRHVKGLTTAAAIWLTAAIGLLCGIGELKIAAITTVLAIIVLALDFFGSRLWSKFVKATGDQDEFIPRDGD